MDNEIKEVVKMKRGIRITLLICVLSALFACSESHSTLTVKRNGTVSYDYSFGLMQVVYEAARSNDADPFQTIRTKLSESGFQVSDYQQDGYQGIRAHAEFPSMEAFKRSLDANKEQLGASLTVETKKGLFRSMVTLIVKTDYSAVGDDLVTNDEAEGFLPENFTKNMNYTYAIRTPYKVLTHNASQADEKEGLYTWTLDPFAENHLELTYEKVHTGMWILLAVLCAAAATLIIFFLWKRGMISFQKEPRFIKK